MACFYKNGIGQIISYFWQRVRWFWGVVQTSFQYRKMVLRRRYGAIGCYVMPFQNTFHLLSPVFLIMNYAVLAYAYFLLPPLITEFLFQLIVGQLLIGMFINLLMLTLAFTYIHPYEQKRHYLKILLFNFVGSRQAERVCRTIYEIRVR